MKNFINRALVAEKRLFFIFAAVLITASVLAEQKLPRTICGCTLGETTYQQVLTSSNNLPTSENIPWLLAASPKVVVYKGDFVFDGSHFAILSLSFYKDTLYLVELSEIELNTDIWGINKNAIEGLKEKYKDLADYFETSHDTEGFVSVAKTDQQTILMANGSKHELNYKIKDPIFAEKEWKEEVDSLLNIKTGPNYDEKNKVTSIAGVRFGETRNNAINAFKQRGKFIENENKMTYFSDVNFGGVTYDIATLFFQYNSIKFDMALAAAKFEKHFYEWRKDEALMMYKSIVKAFQGKYTNCTMLKDEEDSKIMLCGMLDDSYDEGKLPPIAVSFELGISRGGDKFYYVTVSYFEDRMSSAATDDI